MCKTLLASVKICVLMVARSVIHVVWVGSSVGVAMGSLCDLVLTCTLGSEASGVVGSNVTSGVAG